MSIDIAAIEKTAAAIVNGIIEHEGLINTVATLTGVMPAVAVAEKALPFVAGILQFLQQETGKSLTQVFADFLSHNTPSKPNLPELSPPVDVQAHE